MQPTDDRANVECAYALRQIYPTYHGPQARIKRRADGKLADLYFDATGKLTDVFTVTLPTLENPTFTSDDAVILTGSGWDALYSIN